jgi:uracil-DNA glycosylase
VPEATASFVGRLAEARIGTTFNFYRDGARAEVRRARLVDYLVARERAPILLVGEAAGYRGARVSGIPFTSERQLSGSGPAEASATIVRRVLQELGLEESVLCWNLVPTHPHIPGQPESNRPPTRTEIAAGRGFLDALAAKRRVVALGRLAERELGTSYVRHPAHGGAAAFRAGLIEVLRG